MSGPDPRKQRDEARSWLEKADEDLAVVRLLSPVPSLLGSAAYHAQQAAEKVMKGLLTVAAVPFRKTHNLNELAGQLVLVWPELATLVDPLRDRTNWNFAFRYPTAEAFGEREPSTQEILATVAQIEVLRARLIYLIADED